MMSTKAVVEYGCFFVMQRQNFAGREGEYISGGLRRRRPPLRPPGPEHDPGSGERTAEAGPPVAPPFRRSDISIVQKRKDITSR